MHLNRRTRVAAALILAGSLGLAACGDDDDAPAKSGDPTTSTSEETPTTEAAATIEVTGIDYAFEGLPSEIEAGTELTFTNGSEKEPHELVLFHIPDDEDRSVDELLALPEEEAQAAVGDPVGVAVAAQPGEPGEVVEGELVVEEPGRYVALCFLPVGSTPESMEDENAQPSGPPHFTQGMRTEFTVE